MTEAGNSDARDNAKHSGCGCAPKAAPAAETAKSVCCGGHDHSGHGHRTSAKTSVRDPVCGMIVDPATSKHRFDHHGETYHFCSAGCRTKFAADPAKYLDKREPPAEMPAGTIYTCPMHPEIRQQGPGTCPICGMALEPDVISINDVSITLFADMKRSM